MKYAGIAGLRAHNWQKWKNTFLTCPCYNIYRVEAILTYLQHIHFTNLNQPAMIDYSKIFIAGNLNQSAMIDYSKIFIAGNLTLQFGYLSRMYLF